MRQGGDGPRLALEARARGVILRQVGRKDLHRDLSPEPHVEGAIHISHPAGAAERGPDLVWVQTCARGKRQSARVRS